MEINRYASPFQIGNVIIPNRTVFAPMAGVSDLPFRLLCHEQGAGLVCMEMISAKAITFRSRRTGELWETAPEEKPVSLQIFGHEPDVMAEACRILEDPQEKIRGLNCLMKLQTGREFPITAAMADSVNVYEITVPVISCKMRKK